MTRFIFFVLLTVLLVGCRVDSTAPTPDPTILINIRFEPDPPTVGQGTLIVILRDAAGFPLDNVTVFVRGDMTHAGMVPVEYETTQSADGEYPIAFDWNMAGDWILTVRAVLADGSVTEVQFNVTVGG